MTSEPSLAARLLAEAHDAVIAGQWDVVEARARALLAVDPSSSDAQDLLTVAQRGRSAGTGADKHSAPTSNTIAAATVQRPWYKKKRYWAAGSVAALILIGSFGNAGDGKEIQRTAATTTVQTKPATQQATAKATSGLVRGQIGERVSVGDLDLTVESAEGFNTRTYNQFNDANVRVRLTATNVRGRDDRTYDISIFAFKLIDGNGVAYSQTLACAGCPEEISNTSLTRGGTVRGAIYFAVPAGATLNEVRYEPLFSTNKAFIGLGR
jgi:hypothetical protein